MAHEHKNAYSLDNQIVCNGCITEDQFGGNECFCECHEQLKLRCIKCKMFHQ